MSRIGTQPEIAPPLTLVGGATAPVEEPVSTRPTPSEPAEAEWVAAAVAGDLGAWSRLYHDHFDAVYSHVCYLTGDAVLAEDLVQDVFARAMTHIERYDGRATFLAWIRGIALNVVRMHWRRASTTERVHADLRHQVEITDTVPGQPDRAHVQEQRMRMLYAVLSSIPESLREAFIVRELEGMPARQAAAQLGITPGNLAVRLTRARTRIRKELNRRGWLTETDR